MPCCIHGTHIHVDVHVGTIFLFYTEKSSDYADVDFTKLSRPISLHPVNALLKERKTHVHVQGILSPNCSRNCFQMDAWGTKFVHLFANISVRDAGRVGRWITASTWKGCQQFF